MKRIVFLMIALLAIPVLSLSSISESDQTVSGIVVYDGKSDFHIVETNSYFVIMEWYGGPDFSKGDKIVGELHSYGFKYVKVNKQAKETKIYIENYWQSKEKCFEWLKDNGKLK